MLIPNKQLAVTLAGICLLVAAGFAFLNWHFARTREALVHDVAQNISRVRDELRATAEATSRNGLDADMTGVAIDCSERNSFEELLGKLNTLSRGDLANVSRLFDRCGDHYALRKRLMAAKLAGLDTEFEAAVALWSSYGGGDAYAPEVAAWSDIVKGEKQRADLLTEQTVLQGDIIDILSGNSKDKLSEVVGRAQDIGQLLDVTGQQIDAWRAGEETIWTQATATK